MSLPLFPGIPGGPELLVLLLLTAVPLFGLAVVYAIYLLGARLSGAKSTDDGGT